MIRERLPDGHEWLRVADPAWSDPLDPGFARRHGGRWNPPDSFEVLYLNEDVVTARLNLRLFLHDKPYGATDLREDAGPCLVGARLPRGQVVADVHSSAGVAAVGLPGTYPMDRDGALVSRAVCQTIGGRVREAGLRGVRCRSASGPLGAGRELAWFPAGARSRARRMGTIGFGAWFWA